MAAAVVYFRHAIEGLGGYGYLGAFVISIMGGATIIIPIPMLAVVFALGGALKYTWLLGVVSGLGETVGALTIYMTGYGGGAAISKGFHGKLQVAYERMMAQMQKRGSWTLFLLASVINPFFYPAALAAGALRFGIVKYFVVCWAGKTIKGLTVAYAGYYGLRGILQALGVPL
jgi:membrane protein YqaA with SNARE-associated domain